MNAVSMPDLPDSVYTNGKLDMSKFNHWLFNHLLEEDFWRERSR